MARDSRRADPRRVVAVDSDGSSGDATVRCKLVLILLTLAIIVPVAYAESQGESREFLQFFSLVLARYVTSSFNFS